MRSHYYLKGVAFKLKHWKRSICWHHTDLRISEVNVATWNLLIDWHFRHKLAEILTPNFDVSFLTSSHHKRITIDERLDRTIVNLDDLLHQSWVVVYHINKATICSRVNHLNLAFDIRLLDETNCWVYEHFTATCIIKIHNLAGQEVVFYLEKSDHTLIVHRLHQHITLPFISLLENCLWDFSLRHWFLFFFFYLCFLGWFLP